MFRMFRHVQVFCKYEHNAIFSSNKAQILEYLWGHPFATLDGGGELLLAHLRLNQTVEGARCKTFHASQGWWEEFSAKLPAVVGWEIDGRDLICAYEYGTGLSEHTIRCHYRWVGFGWSLICFSVTFDLFQCAPVKTLNGCVHKRTKALLSSN
jgi:hypothetical protein